MMRRDFTGLDIRQVLEHDHEAAHTSRIVGYLLAALLICALALWVDIEFAEDSSAAVGAGRSTVASEGPDVPAESKTGEPAPSSEKVVERVTGGARR